MSESASARPRIGVFGLGFVGLTTALGFAEKGYAVKGYDVNKDRLDTIARGTLPFLEPGLDAALTRNLGKTFAAAATAREAAQESDCLFFCVGTPCGENGKADLTYLYSALDSVLPVLADGRFRVLVVKSTVPPGTTQNEVIPYLKRNGGPETYAVANNPEFLREGKCWDDFIKPDRIVCGTEDRRAAELLRAVYAPFDAPIHIVSPNTAEFIKYLSNTLLATLISYSNEMAMAAGSIGGIETGRAFRVLHEDKRLAGSGIAGYVYPGCGYGGYCLPKDTEAMAAQTRAVGASAALLEKVIAVNDKMPAYFVEQITRAAAAGERIGILGLSFKPESDDVRDSPSAKIIRLLQDAGCRSIAAYDPAANQQFDAAYHFQHIDYCPSKETLCQKSEVLVLATAWSEFKNLRREHPEKKWIDCRYFLDKEHD
jgi:UDPglucose 6-dehydrogenase